MTLPRKAGYVVTRHVVQQFFSSNTTATSTSLPTTNGVSNSSTFFGQVPVADPFSHVNVAIPAYVRSIDNNAQFFSTSPYVAAYPPARFVAESETLSTTSSVEAPLDHLPSLHWNWASNDQTVGEVGPIATQSLIDSGETPIRTAESLSFEEIGTLLSRLSFQQPWLTMALHVCSSKEACSYGESLSAVNVTEFGSL